MSKAKETKNVIVGLDIGTSKIAAIVAELKPDGGFEVIGMGGDRKSTRLNSSHT